MMNSYIIERRGWSHLPVSVRSVFIAKVGLELLFESTDSESLQGLGIHVLMSTSSDSGTRAWALRGSLGKY